MKNYLKLTLSILLAVAFTELHAQIKSEYLFGLNLSTMTIKNKGISYETGTPVGFHFGRNFEVPLNDHLALQTSLLLSAKGTDYKIDTIDISISPIYLEVPVNAVFNFGSRMVKVSLFTGPFIAYGLGGYRIESGSGLRKIKYGSGETHDLKPFDIGLNLGARVNIKSLMISVQYGIGLANISPVTSLTSEIKNQVIGISFSLGGNGLNAKF